MSIFFKEHQEILALLNKHNVRYLIIGGYAVIFHGYARTTGDLDIWLKPSNDNKLALVKALSEAKYDESDLQTLSSFDFEEHQVFSIGTRPSKIDFLTRINQVQFDTAYNQRVEDQYEKLVVPVISLANLVLSKFNTGRQKDISDIEELQKIAKNK